MGNIAFVEPKDSSSLDAIKDAIVEAQNKRIPYVLVGNRYVIKPLSCPAKFLKKGDRKNDAYFVGWIRQTRVY